MFVHVGFRPLWPAVFLLPWFIFGITCLFEPLLHRRSRGANLGEAVPGAHQRSPLSGD